MACDREGRDSLKTEDTLSWGDLRIDELSPDQGVVWGGDLVTLKGEGFSPGAQLQFEGRPCQTLTILSSAELTCRTPDLSEGGLEDRTVEAWLFRPEDGQEARMEFEISGDPSLDTGDHAGGEGGEVDPVPTEVDYCHIQWPCSISVSQGASTEPIYAWVYQTGITEGEGQGPGIRVELGVGADGADDPEDFSWIDAAYQGDKDGLVTGDLANDEYVGSLQSGDAGDYDIAARVSADEGLSWTLCDLGGGSCGGAGSSDGYSPDDSVPLSVGAGAQ
jgi:hypothetical protein